MLSADTRTFFKQFLRDKTGICAVAPSSGVLARRITQWIDWPQAGVVAEYGPGTGVFTRDVLTRLKPGARFFAIELNPTFVALMRERFPQVSVHEESVRNVAEVCRREGVAHLDAVVSGLPWGMFPDDEQTACLDEMVKLLRPGGQFTTFWYIQGHWRRGARLWRERLRERFSRVDITWPVWRNMPPALLYRCVK